MFSGVGEVRFGRLPMTRILNRRRRVAGLVVLTTAALVAGCRDRPDPSSTDAPRPNIVLIVADGYGDLGICGLRHVSERAHDGPAYRPHACLGQYVRQAHRRSPRTRTPTETASSRNRARAGTYADVSKRTCPQTGQMRQHRFCGEKLSAFSGLTV